MTRLRTAPARALALGLALLLSLALPARLHAHGALRRAVPSDGAHLSEAPRELRLTFNEPVEVAVARLALLGPDGAPAALGPLRLSPDSSTVLLAEIVGPLAAGSYTVAWQVAGADGHPVRGRYNFVIAPGAAGLAPTPGEAPAEPHAAEHPAVSFPEGPGFDAGSPLYAAVRWLTFLGVLGVVGAVAFRLLVLPGARRREAAGAALFAPAARRAAGLGLALGALLAVAAALRLYAQSYALHGPEGALEAALVWTMLSRTVWGWGWTLQAAAAALALAGFSLARRGSRAGWPLAAAAALLAAFSPALSGHAAAVPGRAALAVVADGVHVLGAGGWLGGLLLVLGAGVPAALRLGAEERGRGVAALVNAFSPVALLCAGVVVSTGVLSAALHLETLSDLWGSGYGRTLLLKLALLAGVFGTGAYNWLRVRPALGSEAAAGRLRRSAALELAVGALVLAATAVLVATTPAAAG